MHVDIPMSIVVWVVVGGIAGLLASVVIRGTGLGLLGDIVLGIIGAVLASFIATKLGYQGITGINLYSIVVAFIGAVILLLLIRVVNGRGMYRRRRAL
jgi:uncharacterized membrane protein YeaQ/YmgE (transglycosylase-associated protein family)